MEKTVLQRMADLITRAENSDPSTLDQKLRRISDDITHFRHTLTQASDKLSHTGKTQAKTLENIYQTTKTIINTQCTQLNKASMTTVKNISQLVSSVRKNHLAKLTEQKLGELKKSRNISTQRIRQRISSLHWKNFITVTLLTLVVASVVSLYVDNAWPWQAHNEILKEREAGKILLSVWPQLSAKDQAIIVQNA